MKRQLKIFVLLLLAAGNICVTNAQQTLTLAACLEQAKQHNATLQSAKLDVAMSREVKKQMLWKYFPQVGIEAFAFGAAKPLIDVDVVNMAGGDTGDLLNGLFEMLNDLTGKEYSSEVKWMRWGASAQVQAVQPIFWGGQIVNANKLAKLGINASQLKGEMSERDVLQEVTETYWLIVGLMEKRRTVEQAIELLDTVHNVAEMAFNHGLVTRNDLLKVQLKQNEIGTKAVQLENGIHLASRALCHLIGMPYTQELRLDTFPEVEEVETLVLLPDSFTIDGRPEAELLEMAIRAEQLRKKITMGEALPHLGIGLRGGYTNFFERHKVNGLAFASLTIPLTMWGETGHKLKEHNLKIRQAELQRDDLKAKMSLQNEQVYDQLTESIRLMEQHRSGRELAKDNYQISLMNYQAGMSTMSELLEAETLLLQAQNAYTDARISYRAAQRKFNALNK